MALAPRSLPWLSGRASELVTKQKVTCFVPSSLCHWFLKVKGIWRGRWSPRITALVSHGQLPNLNNLQILIFTLCPFGTMHQRKICRRHQIKLNAFILISDNDKVHNNYTAVLAYSIATKLKSLRNQKGFVRRDKCPQMIFSKK